MRSEKVTYCEKLMKDTNEIISRLDAKAIGGMVQWGDLRCVSVEWGDDGLMRTGWTGDRENPLLGHALSSARF